MLQLIKSISFVKSDVVGISASFACIIHCMATPVLVSLGFILNESFFGQWALFDYVFILMALVAVSMSAKSTSSSLLKVAFWLALAIFSTSIVMHDELIGAHYLSLGSSVFLIFLHLIHWRMTVKRKVNRKSIPDFVKK